MKCLINGRKSLFSRSSTDQVGDRGLTQSILVLLIGLHQQLINDYRIRWPTTESTAIKHSRTSELSS